MKYTPKTSAEIIAIAKENMSNPVKRLKAVTRDLLNKCQDIEKVESCHSILTEEKR